MHSRIHLWPLIAILAAIVVSMTYAWAAGEESGDPEEATPTPYVAGQDIVVTGTRTSHSAEDAPVATSVVNKEEIVNSGASDAGAALENVPGVFVDNYEPASRGGPGTGVNLLGMPTDRVLVLIDGQREPITMRAPDLELIPAEIIRRIEVVKGPSSSLYGSDAIGGVINIITRDPTQDPVGELTLKGGSFSTFRGDAFHSWSAGPVGWVANFNREQSQGWIDAYNARPIVEIGEGVVGNYLVPYQDSHPYETNDIFGKVYYQTGEYVRLRAESRYHWEDNHFWDEDDGAVSDYKTRLSGLAGADMQYGALNASLTGGYYRRTFRYRENSSSYTINPLPPPDYIRTLINKGNDTIGDNFNGELVLSGPLAGWNLLTGGVSYRHEILNYSAFEESSVSDSDQSYNAYQTILSAFAQDELFFFSDVWSLVPGVRVDNHDRWGTVVNPKLSTLVKATPSTSFRASIGRAFREPMLSQLYRPLFRHTGYYLEGNEDLKPETAIGWNGEVEQKFEQTASVTAGYFQYEMWDMIFESIVNENFKNGFPLMTYLNLTRARIYGAESQVMLAPWRYMKLGFNYTWTKTLDLDENTSLGTVPEHNAGTRLFVDYDPWGLGGFIGVTYESERNYIGMGGRWYEADPNWITAARIYKTLGKHVQLAFMVNNWLGYKWDRDGDSDNDMPPTGYFGELKLSL